MDEARQDCKIAGIDFESLSIEEKSSRIWIRSAPTYTDVDYQKDRFKLDREIKQANENLKYLNDLHDRLFKRDS